MTNDEYKADLEEHNKKLEDEIEVLNSNLDKTKEKLSHIKSIDDALEAANINVSVSKQSIKEMEDMHNINAIEMVVEMAEFEMVCSVGRNKIVREELRKRYPHHFGNKTSIENRWNEYDKQGESK